jgi:hypothetical protein
MILTKLFVILLTILLILEMVKYFKHKRNPVREGMEDPGLGKDPVYLSTLNASNITILKEKVDELVGLKQQLADLTVKVDQNSSAITQLGTQMSDNANKAVGRDPNSTEPLPQATGLN